MLTETESIRAPKDRVAARALFWVSAGVLISWSAHNGFLLPWEVRNVPVSVREPVLVLLRALVWLVPSVLYLRLHEPRPRLVALGVTSRVNRRGLAWSVVGALAYLLLMGSLLASSTPAEERPALLSVLVSVQVVYQVLKVVLEELLLRGFLLGQLNRFTSAFRAQASVAVLFGLLHVPGWIALQGVTVGLIPSTIVLTLLGAVLGYVARASNSILPAIALHLANNLMADWLGGG